MKKWVVAAKKADFNGIAEKYNITPMLARIIRNRDVIEDADINKFLNGTLEDLYPAGLLKDIDKAVDIIREAKKNGLKTRIVGDYDIDGVCASYILYKGFSKFGLESDVRLPDRVRDGYGLNSNIIDEAINDGVKLIVTCDNGIAARAEIEYAKNNGMTVIVTDHHEVPYEIVDDEKTYLLPCADAVIDPKQSDCTYPYKEICGAVVAYKLIESMFNDMELPAEEIEGLKDELLQFAAFATVGDVMPLLDENRIIVKYGLKLMGRSTNQGINALIDVTNIDRTMLNPYHIGFILGPCVNATGRLDNATRALSLFMAEDRGSAVTIAKELKELNDSRKQMTETFSAIGMKMASSMQEDKVLVIYIPDCHESLAGIVAGRIKEKFYKPTFVLTKGDENVKGSGRSIEAYNMYEEMTKVNDLFIKYGGHKMAAGLSIEEEKIDELRYRLNENNTLTEEQLIEKIVIDIPMPMKYASLDFVNELDRLAPYGMGNSKPLFAEKNVSVLNTFVMGKNRNALKLKLKPEGSEQTFDGIIFGNGDELAEEIAKKDKISVIYQPQINEYMGNKSIQVAIKEWM